jgi:hypothetical protein
VEHGSTRRRHAAPDADVARGVLATLRAACTAGAVRVHVHVAATRARRAGRGAAIRPADASPPKIARSRRPAWDPVRPRTEKPAQRSRPAASDTDRERAGPRNGREGARSERKRFPKAKVDREGTVQLQAALYIVRIPSATRHANHHVTPMRSASIAPTVIGCSRFQCVLTISVTACLVARFARERPNLGGRRPPRVASAGNIVCARAHHAAAPASCA